MAQDFFGYNRTVGSSNQLSSSEHATLTVGDSVSLCQSVNATYQQEIKPIYEVGNPSIFFVPGHASGTLSFARLAGDGGFFKNLKNKQCGKVDTVSINSENGTCFASSGTLSFDGAIIRSVSLTMNTGAIEITEQAEIVVASMS
jgi:hypothetical protein